MPPPRDRTPLHTSLLALGRELGQGLLQILYPAVCHLCGRSLPGGSPGFCDTCRSALTTDPYPACPRCAGTVGPFALVEGGCASCREVPLHFDRAIRLAPYDGLLREVALRLKHWHAEGLAEAVGALWAEHAEAALRGLQAEVVIPVPLHWFRRLRRGYNQSEVLARALATRLGLPCRPRLLRRVRYTPRQSGGMEQRRDNVRGAFSAAAAGLKGKTVLLVDDVLTTGSTCNESARALRGAGARRVVVAVLAHSHRK